MLYILHIFCILPIAKRPEHGPGAGMNKTQMQMQQVAHPRKIKQPGLLKTVVNASPPHDHKARVNEVVCVYYVWQLGISQKGKHRNDQKRRSHNQANTSSGSRCLCPMEFFFYRREKVKNTSREA